MTDPDPFHLSQGIATHTPPGPPDGSSSSSSSSRNGGNGPGGSPHWPGSHGDPSGGGSQRGSAATSRGVRSAAVGSERVLSEESVYRYKALQSVKTDSLPQHAAAFRSWKNGLVTRLCPIDVTGQNIILGWVLEALDPSADLDAGACIALPRLEAYIAATLAHAKHLKADLGVQFQAHCEQCQQRRVSPKGRYMLQMIARRFQLDLNRGANLTQQSLLELTLDTYSQEGLSKFVERIELVLNSIPT